MDIKRMTKDNIYGEPTYYELIDNVKLNKLLYYPIITADCYLLTYKEASLLGPQSIPLCRYYYAGIKKFMIGDNEYSTYDIDKRQLDQRSRLLNESGSIDNYKDVQWWLGKSPRHYKLNECTDADKRIMSALGKIEAGAEEYQRICVYQC